MRFKKAESDPKELVLTIVIVALLAIVGVLIYSSVTKVGDSLIDPDISTVVNESVTITAETEDATNSSALAQLGVLINTDSVLNATSGILVRNTDYRITVSDSTTGSLVSRGNFTVLNMDAYNATELFVSYDKNIQSEAQSTKTVIDNTVLDSYELGVIALIVLAAVVILAVLFRMGQ